MTIRPASRAFWMVGTIALESLGTMAKPLAPAEIMVLDRGNLAVIVAVKLAGAGHELDAEFLRLFLGAFAHLDEERVGFGLGDQPDDVGCRGRAGEPERECARGSNKAKLSVHVFLPWMTEFSTGFALFVRALTRLPRPPTRHTKLWRSQ